MTELDGASLPLNTSYDALVDGTKGDVELKRVDVTLGKSKMAARGVVEGTKGIKGKRVVVNVKSSSTDLGELLRLVSKAAQPAADGVADRSMRRWICRRASSRSSSGWRSKDRCGRARQVHATTRCRTRSTSSAAAAQGRPTDASIDEVASQMATKFVLNNGVFTYQGLSFNVQGAQIRLDGTHSLRSKTVDFAGVVLLNATVSQTQTGYQELVAEAVRSAVQKERRRHPIGHHRGRHPGSTEGWSRFRQDPQGQVIVSGAGD